jgi:hypothetical protein
MGAVPDEGVTYGDQDLVYVDPDNRLIIGPVEWLKNGNPKPLPIPETEPEEGKRKRGGGRKYFPWGTYRSVKNMYRIGGKKKDEPTESLDEVMGKAMRDPYWD